MTMGIDIGVARATRRTPRNLRFSNFDVTAPDGCTQYWCVERSSYRIAYPTAGNVLASTLTLGGAATTAASDIAVHWRSRLPARATPKDAAGLFNPVDMAAEAVALDGGTRHDASLVTCKFRAGQRRSGSRVDALTCGQGS